MDRSDRFIIQVISVILCVFLLVYVSFHAVNIDAEPYETEVALTYSISDGVDAAGVIVRQEQLIAGQATGGTVSYQQSDGTMVKEGSVIAEVYSSSSDIALRRQIRALRSGAGEVDKGALAEIEGDDPVDGSVLDCRNGAFELVAGGDLHCGALLSGR